MRIALTVFFVVSLSVFGHGGGVDENGGHYDKKSGGYHCHKAPCDSIHSTSDLALTEAEKEKRAFSFTYNRDDWKHWVDVDGDCINTRHEVLISQADGPVTLSPNGCYVSMGVWNDPFSGKQFTRASDLDVDHIVPLKWANDHGGGHWSSKVKERFANDPLNLLAVDDGLNQSKGAKGPTEWLPPNQSFHCQYISMWSAVLNVYSDLKMRPSEVSLFNQQIESCKN